jgi:hypothetical protein
MATLAIDKPRDYELGDVNEFPVIADDIIYEGAAVGDNAAGYARPLVAGDLFRGFATRKAANAGGAAGDQTVEVNTRGRLVLPISGVAITDVGKEVYASDDDTFTLTMGTNTRIGFVYRFISSGYAVVEFNAACGYVTELTDSTGGTVSDTLAAGIADAVAKNAIAALAAKVNFLLRKLK